MTAVIPGRAPSNDVELVRSFHDRIRKLETKSTVRVGPWVLSASQDDGGIVATRPGEAYKLNPMAAPVALGVGSDAENPVGPSADSIFALLYKQLTGIGIDPLGALNALGGFLKQELSGALDITRLPMFEVVSQVLDRLADSIFGNHDPVSRHPPYKVPFIPGREVTPVDTFFTNLKSWLHFDLMAIDFDPVSAAVHFAQNVLKPLEVFASLVNGRLPDIQAPQIVADIINTIERAVDNTPIVGPIVGNIIDPIFNALRTLLGIGQQAQTSANTANTSVASILAKLNAQGVVDGVSISVEFNEARANALDPNIWHQNPFGPGNGSDGPDGNGNLHWFEQGYAVRGVTSRHLTPLHTGRQSVAILLSSKPVYWLGGAASWKMQARMNATETDWVEAWFVKNGYNDLEYGISYALNNTVTRLGGSARAADNEGDVWEFRPGVGTGPDADYTFEIVQNGVTKMSRVDTAHASAFDQDTHLYSAITRIAGVDQFFGVLTQKPCPDFGVFAAADRA
jgi:hypothetical protein